MTEFTETRKRLIQISAVTIDRLLALERRKHRIKGRLRSNPRPLLKHQIPLERFAPWQEDRPAWSEAIATSKPSGP